MLPANIDAFATTAPEDAAATTQRMGHLATLLAQLSPKVRATLIWHRRDGRTYEEIGARLAVPRNRVKKYLAKALAHCRKGAAVLAAAGVDPIAL